LKFSETIQEEKITEDTSNITEGKDEEVKETNMKEEEQTPKYFQ
jgi:hypothetical protein